jgi:methyltransferase
MKGGNGSFWKKKKQRPNEDNSNKALGNPSKRSYGESSVETGVVKASEAAWASKLLPDSLEKGSPSTFTISIAIPSSILKTAKSPELKAFLVGQIARACAIHEVDEIIIYMDTYFDLNEEPEKGPGLFICRLLQYLECPVYMRSALFPVNDSLKLASLLPALNMPHHMSSECVSLYREGVVVGKPVSNGSLVNVGLPVEAFIEHQLQAGVRVTVKLADTTSVTSSSTKVPLIGEAVSPLAVRQEHGLYWGYQTRLVSSFSEVFSGCPYDDDVAPTGYDLLIGHSETGSKTLDSVSINSKPFKHALIVFGGVGGIEACVESDQSITIAAKNSESLFDHWLNLAPSGGSRTVRTEEALLIGLAKLTSVLGKKQ